MEVYLQRVLGAYALEDIATQNKCESNLSIPSESFFLIHLSPPPQLCRSIQSIGLGGEKEGERKGREVLRRWKMGDEGCIREKSMDQEQRRRE